MKEITFRYKDKYTNDEWRTQHCIVSSLDECIRIYGLNEIEYEISGIKDKTK